MIVETCLLLVAAIVLVWIYSKRRFSYWSSKDVVCPPILPLIGHMNYFFKGQRWVSLHKFYLEFRKHKFYGLYEFFNPVLMITDPELLKLVLVKDFEYFVDRRRFGDQEGSLMTEMLTNKFGEEWKDLRAIMTPTFSSGKMRSMFHLISEKADNLVSFSLKNAVNNKPVDMKDMFGRFTMDTIASCAFGIECNSLSDSKPVFAEVAEKFFNFQGLKALKLTLMIVLPKLHNFLGFKVDDVEIEFFAKLAKENMELRKKGQSRGDFLDLLLNAKASEDDIRPGKKVFGEHTLVAQSVLFLVAGYDTTASALAFSSYNVAMNVHCQHRLRQELQELVKEHGSINYQGIMEAKYLDAVLMETLRLYPPGTIGERVCTKQYKIPDTDLIMNPGDLIQFPLWSIHHDPQYWPEPEEFKPERFLAENRGSIISFTHLPFGMGPRNCIAMRFALMEAKVALAQLILAAEIKLAPGHEKMELQDSPFLMRPKDGVMLMLTPLQKD
ncbi:cytochrome P450 9e2-like [Portunus trituberculatus]|uniref:cytochrome P450 9e2-like n=1 Tax=Portunus trituberculatus TaxID=210409 RepID=UPI001E1CDB29|nr:cytochrome P450 9e2-like [Portunus trituberculatus]